MKTEGSTEIIKGFKIILIFHLYLGSFQNSLAIDSLSDSNWILPASPDSKGAISKAQWKWVIFSCILVGAEINLCRWWGLFKLLISSVHFESDPSCLF